MLVEAVIALFVTSLIFSAIFVSQQALVTRMNSAWQRVNRILMCYEYVAELCIKIPYLKADEFAKGSKSYEDPELEIQHAVVDIDKRSTLARVEGLKMIKTTGTWHLLGTPKSETLITLRYIPAEPKSTNPQGSPQ